ncbi:hypothetical protein [Rhizobium sp. EC-SD404]|uniref:hypothetical protein n=1 Tax=Rhizobium sp. EC-SD404 TaxID=2038389 RepID=UPI0018FE1882|nr:hypothetical protein [Rhizobium sp. EC-SD404]
MLIGSHGLKFGMRASVALATAVALSGCSGFVSGGVAGASMSDGRVAVESRSATAAVGPSGPSVQTRRGSAAICVDPLTNAATAC